MIISLLLSISSFSIASVLHQQQLQSALSSPYYNLYSAVNPGQVSNVNGGNLNNSITPLPPIISNPKLHPQTQIPTHLLHSIVHNIPPTTNAKASQTTKMNLSSANSSNPVIMKFSPPLSGNANPSESTSLTHKKRKTGIRACDGCAIRKTKCEERRPCRHCFNNGLECTDLRERKKSGPKNLRKKTIDSINSIRDGTSSQSNNNTDSKNASISPPPPPPPPPLSNRSSTSGVPVIENKPIADGGQGFQNNANANGVLVTPIVLVEILVLADHPSLSRVLKSLTIPSFLNNIPKLIEFIQISFQNKFNSINENNSNDPIFLSELLAILTLCLLIIENIIKFNYFNYQDFQIFNNDILKLKNFTFFLQNKIIDTFTLLNKILVFPNIMNNNFDSSNISKFHHFQINYNQSISSLHLFNYYRITSSLNNSQHFKDQQKLINLRKAITHYQLIEIPYKNNLNVIQLYELYESLYSLETLNCLLDTHLFIKNSHLILDIWNSNILSILNNDNNKSNELFELLKNINTDRDIFNGNSIQILSKFLNINTKALLRKGDSIDEAENSYLLLKKQIWKDNDFGEGQTIESSIVIVIKHILLFKKLIANTSSFNNADFKAELLAIVKNLNPLFKNLLKLSGDTGNPAPPNSKDDNVILKIELSNYQLLPHLLQILKIYLDLSPTMDNNTIGKDDNLVSFSNYLTQFFITYAESNKFIKSDAILNEWFITLNKINFENQTYLNNLLNDLETTVKVMASKPSNSDFSSSLALSQPQLESKLQPSKIKEESRSGSRPQLDDEEDDDDDDDDEQFLSLPAPTSKSSSAAAAAAAAAASVAENKDKTTLLPPSTPSRPLVNTSPSTTLLGGFNKVPSLRQMLLPTGLTPLMNNGSSFLKNQNSVTSLLALHNPDTAHLSKEEEASNINSLSLSESTKNLYNLFNQFTDDLTTTSNNNSLTNLFQFSSLSGANGSGSVANLSSNLGSSRIATSGANLASSGLGGNSISSANINNTLLNGINSTSSDGSNSKIEPSQIKNQFSF